MPAKAATRSAKIRAKNLPQKLTDWLSGRYKGLREIQLRMRVYSRGANRFEPTGVVVEVTNADGTDVGPGLESTTPFADTLTALDDAFEKFHDDEAADRYQLFLWNAPAAGGDSLIEGEKKSFASLDHGGIVDADDDEKSVMLTAFKTSLAEARKDRDESRKDRDALHKHYLELATKVVDFAGALKDPLVGAAAIFNEGMSLRTQSFDSLANAVLTGMDGDGFNIDADQAERMVDRLFNWLEKKRTPGAKGEKDDKTTGSISTPLDTLRAFFSGVGSLFWIEAMTELSAEALELLRGLEKSDTDSEIVSALDKLDKLENSGVEKFFAKLPKKMQEQFWAVAKAAEQSAAA